MGVNRRRILGGGVGMLWIGLSGPVMAERMEKMDSAEDLDPVLERRARLLGRRLRCPICQGEPIDESLSDFAVRVRTEIRRKLAEGLSDEEIIDLMILRYGPAIDGRPVEGGWSMVLWALGPLAIVLGIGLAWWGRPRRRGLGRTRGVRGVERGLRIT